MLASQNKRSLRAVLVTGGAGFIGSSLVRCLLARDEVERVVVLDLLTYAGDYANLEGPDRDPRFSFVQGDICDGELVLRVMQEARLEGIFHLAAESHVDRSIASGAEFVQTNVLGTQVLLRVAREVGVPLLHCSTDEVYGSIPVGQKATEVFPIRPSSPYSASKAAADLLCQAAIVTHGQDVVITRCTNNYGERQHVEKLIPQLVYRALRDEPLPIYGDGLNTRDWLYVDDHCEGMILAWLQGRSGSIHHFAGHAERTNLGLARSVLQLLRKPEHLISHVEDRPGHDRRYALDTGTTASLLKWRPRHKFSQSFPETIRALAARHRP